MQTAKPSSLLRIAAFHALGFGAFFLTTEIWFVHAVVTGFIGGILLISIGALSILFFAHVRAKRRILRAERLVTERPDDPHSTALARKILEACERELNAVWPKRTREYCRTMQTPTRAAYYLLWSFVGAALFAYTQSYWLLALFCINAVMLHIHVYLGAQVHEN